MPLQPGEVYTPANAAEIRDDFLTDIRLGLIDQDVSDETAAQLVAPNTHWWLLASAEGNAGILQYANIRVQADNQDVLNASGEALDHIREAEGLPVVSPSGSTGNVLASVSGGATITITDGTAGVLPNGKRVSVSGLHSNVTDQDPIALVADDTGSDTNLAAGKKVRWVSPPTNLEEQARVDPARPLTGGTDEESDERKRERILNRRANPPQGGNWSHKIEVALNALASVQMAFVYPALGGPGSTRVVAVKDIDPDNGDFTRALSADATDIVRAAIHAEFGTPFELAANTAVEESTDVALTVTIPDAASAGGDGTGWRDETPWPDLGGGTRVQISTVHANNDITINSNTATSAIANVTHVAIWSSTDQQFVTRLVTAVSGSSGAWRITLDKPVVDSQGNPMATSDFVCPDAINIVAYGRTWREVMRRLGPGENTSDANRTPRANRHPDPTRTFRLKDGTVIRRWLSDLTIKQLDEMVEAHDEISDVAWSYRSVSTPTVPGSVNTAPNILIPGQFGIYPTP